MNHTIDEVKLKTDLLQYAQMAGAELKEHGGIYTSVCPLHGGADNPTAFNIYMKNGEMLWNCHTHCGGGDAISFVQKWQFSHLGYKQGFKQALQWIAGDEQFDPVELQKSAEERHRRSEEQLRQAQALEEARRNELRLANKHLLYHQNMRQLHRDEWLNAGVDEDLQELWCLGGTDAFSYMSADKLYHSPTLTIPYFNTGNEVMTIQHRLLNPVDAHDKYRPDKAGLHTHPWFAVPEAGWDGEMVWLVEGAKKAMVTWSRSSNWWQVISVASKGEFKKYAEELRPVAHKLIIVPDPDAMAEGRVLATEIGARTLELPVKIDDYLITVNGDQDLLYKLSKQARK